MELIIQRCKELENRILPFKDLKFTVVCSIQSSRLKVIVKFVCGWNLKIQNPLVI